MRNLRGFVLVAALSLGAGMAPAPLARAGEPTASPPATTAPPATAPAPTAPPPAAPVAPATAPPVGSSLATATPPAVATASSAAVSAAAQGVVVIAIGDDAVPAARALAREVYADATLSPRIDDATARVLAGEAVPAGGSAKLVEIADVRRAAQGSAADTVTRRLFASLGADLGAALVVPVRIRDGRPTARVVSVAKGSFEPVELQGSIEVQPDGSSRVKWAGVTAILAGVLPGGRVAPGTSGAGPGSTAPASTTRPGPLAPKKEEPSTASAIFSSPWTWVGLGVVAVAGGIVFAVSQSQGDTGMLRLQGRVAP